MSIIRIEAREKEEKKGSRGNDREPDRPGRAMFRAAPGADRFQKGDFYDVWSGSIF
jgi:hypothetical protein